MVYLNVRITPTTTTTSILGFENGSVIEDKAIMICLDNSGWMEHIDSPMFQDQLSALKLYCENKFKHPDTTVGVAGMAGSPSTSRWIYPTESLERIISSFELGVIRIGGYMHLVDVAQMAAFKLGPTDMQKRVLIFAGGDLCDSLHDASVLGTEMKLMNVACDVISFGVQDMEKREFFDTLISSANENGNCNLCHVPPESSLIEAISSLFTPHIGGGILSAQPSLLEYYDKEEAIDIYLKPPSHGADNNTDCPFCQTVLLTLKEKGVHYNAHFNTPERISKLNRLETLPLIKFPDGTWVSNSEVIVGMIDKKYEGRSLATSPDFANMGLKILPKLATYLKTFLETKDEKDVSKTPLEIFIETKEEKYDIKQALLYELKELDKHLSEHGGPYVNGEEITAVDLSLAPKLYHLVKACSSKDWDILGELKSHHPNVVNYTESLFNLESFKATEPSEENVTQGWRKRLARK